MFHCKYIILATEIMIYKIIKQVYAEKTLQAFKINIKFTKKVSHKTGAFSLQALFYSTQASKWILKCQFSSAIQYNGMEII
jgi:hypothetical protein